MLIVAGGSPFVLLYYLVSPPVLWIVVLGLAVVGGLIVLYWRFLKWLKKRKAAPMEKDLLKSSTGGTPQGVSEPANLARLDDLRKQFEMGVGKFQAAGKSLYNFPWYMIVGEPGSGKTEAIRHCNVGFPPGLQDELQGTGGTINMNWWFTDHAVLLDTAGRLMFEEVESGGSKEWKEFLNLLKKFRPQCPVNGVLLVIPADSLIKDTTDEIELKASKIARQFDLIQRTLDVRFPVFVVITKSDLIGGFREFFDDLQDPQLQHQIFGWSNPDMLDNPYNPDFVTQHCKAINASLFRRRLTLLRELVSQKSGDPTLRTPDALYAFPHSLNKIAPRMARYLELIFSVGSQWSCKPLFFRGIYFTSSMRDGSALDEDLAESLGVDVDSLPAGRVWQRDRAYFLRDLFMKKVFCEQGLVTNATNAKKQHRRRKAVVLLSAAVSVILLLCFTFYAANRFNRSIGDVKTYFGNLAALSTDDKGIGHARSELQTINSARQYVGRNPIPLMPERVNRANVSANLSGVVSRYQEEGIPWIFSPAAKFAGRITPDKLNRAQAVLYETGVLQPFTEAAQDIMREQQKGEWTYQAPATKVLRQLIQIASQKPLDDQGDYSATRFLDPFSEYVLGYNQSLNAVQDPNKRLRYIDDAPDLHRPLSILYGEALPWPPPSLTSRPDVHKQAIEQGASLFNGYWTDPNRLSEHNKGYAQITRIEALAAALTAFGAAEQELFALRQPFLDESNRPYTVEKLKEFTDAWDAGFAHLRDAKVAADNHLNALAAAPRLEELWTEVSDTTLQEVDKNYAFLLDDMKAVEEEHFLWNVKDQLNTARLNIRNELGKAEFKEELKILDQEHFAEISGQGRLFEIRFDMYSKTDAYLQPASDISTILKVTDSIQKVNKALAEVRKEVNGGNNLGPQSPRMPEASAICQSTLALAEQGRLYQIVKEGLEAAPKSIENLEMFVKDDATMSWDWSGIPEDIRDMKYDPRVVGELLRAWKAVGDTLQNHELPGKAGLKKTYDDANDVYADYRKRCLTDYWLNQIPEDAIRSKVEADLERFKEGSLLATKVCNELDDFGRSLEGALAQFSPEDLQRCEEANKFNAALNQLRDRDLRNNLYELSRKVLEKWSDLGLGPDFRKAQRTLLLLKPRDLREDYAPFEYQLYAEFVNAYWSELTYSLLDEMGKQVQRRGNDAFDLLKNEYSGKFPLERDSQVDLTAQELVKAGVCLNEVQLQEQFDTSTIGGGATTKLDGLDKLLTQLIGTQPPSIDAEWFNRVNQLFKGIPSGQEPYYGRLTLLNQEEQERLVGENEKLLFGDFRECRLVQEKNGTSKSVRTGGSRLDVSMDLVIEYPGEKLSIEFYPFGVENTEDPPKTLSFPGPWACLRLMQKPFYGQEWKCIRFEVNNDRNQPVVLYMRLECFSDKGCTHPVALPEPDKWPSLK